MTTSVEIKIADTRLVIGFRAYENDDEFVIDITWFKKDHILRRIMYFETLKDIFGLKQKRELIDLLSSGPDEIRTDLYSALLVYKKPDGKPAGNIMLFPQYSAITEQEIQKITDENTMLKNQVNELRAQLQKIHEN